MSKLLTLHRPTTLSKLISEVLAEHGTSPLGDIPQWADVLPSEKLPDRRCPLHSTLSRGGLGNPIGHFPRSHGFDLQDPFIQVALQHYNLLHDKHLRMFWTKAAKQHLEALGQIDSKQNVECSIEELNKFRKFLYLETRNKLIQQLNEMGKCRNDTRHCHVVQEYLRTKEDYDEKRLLRTERAQHVFTEKLNRWKNALEKYEQRIKHVALDVARQNQHRKSEGFRRYLRNRVRHKALLALRKKHILMLTRRLRERDDTVRQRLLTHKRRNAEIKATMRQEHYWLHYLAYKRERDEAKETLEKWLGEMHLKVAWWKERYARQHTQLEEDLVRRKTRNLALRYEKRSQKALIRALLTESQKHFWKAPPSDGTFCDKQKTITSAINAARTIHTSLSHTVSSTAIIDTASHFILDLREKPDEPLPLDRPTVRYVVDRLRDAMENILQATVRQGLELTEQVVARQLVQISSMTEQNRRSSLSGGNNLSKETTFATHPGSIRSRVSIGPISIVEQYEADSFAFKRCKNRPPTPVTSVSSLVECSLRQTDKERACTSNLELTGNSLLELTERIHSDDYPLIHLMRSQRRYLETNLLKYRKIVQPYVEQRVFAQATDLRGLLMAGKETCKVDKDTLLHQTADALLKFPTSGSEYANAILNAVHYLSTEAIQKINHILNQA